MKIAVVAQHATPCTRAPAPAVFAGAVTQTARLPASKGPQSTYVRNS